MTTGYTVLPVTGADITDVDGNVTHYNQNDVVPLSELMDRRYGWLVKRGYLGEDMSVDLSTPSIIDAKGDLLVGSGDNAMSRLPVGSDGQVLLSNSGATLGVAWGEIDSGATSRYYLQYSASSDIGGYKVALHSAPTTAEATWTSSISGTGDNLIASFATELTYPGVTELPPGTAFRHIHAKTDSGVVKLKIDLYKRTSGGTETLLQTGYSNNFSNSSVQEIIWSFSDGSGYALNTTDRIVFKLYVARVSGPVNVTPTVYFEGLANQSWIDTTISGLSVSESHSVAGPSSSTDNAIARFDGTGGLLLQNSSATIDDSGVLSSVGASFTGNVSIAKADVSLTLSGTSGTSYLMIRRVAGNYAGTLLQDSSGNSRWLLGVDSAAESGSNAGSDLVLRRYSDAGASLGDVLNITRSTGSVTLSGAQHYVYNGTPTQLDFVKGSRFGYSSGYRAVVLGDTGTAKFISVAIGYDPTGNASGAFTGNGSEIYFRNAMIFKTPNVANDGWYAPMSFTTTGSVALANTPTTPTAAVDTNTTQIASTAFVIGQGYLKSATAASTYAPLAGPTFTGTVTLPSTTSIGTVSSTELGYLDGVTSAIQTQLGTKFNSTGGTITGNVTLYTGAATTTDLVLKSDATGGQSNIRARAGDEERWIMFMRYIDDPDDGSNTGSNFLLRSYTDAGATNADHIAITRSSKLMLLGGSGGEVRVNADPTNALGVVTKQYADTKAPLASPTFTGTVTAADLTVSGTAADVTVDASSGEAGVLIQGVSGQNRTVRFRTGTENRWVFSANATAESGSNAGSNFVLNRYDDDGTFIDAVMTFTRSTGALSLPNGISSEAFTEPSLSNSWVNYGSGHQNVAYMKDAMGFVHLRGTMKSGTTGATVFTLPAGYRPATTQIFTAGANAGTCRVDVPNTGALQVAAYHDSATNAYVSLAGLTFYADG